MSKPLKGAANLAARQRKFHKQLSNMLLSLRSADQQYAMKSSAEEVIFSSDSEAELEDTKPSPVAAFEETYIAFNPGETPNLFQLFGGSDKVPKRHLNAILLELFSVMGNKSNVVDFEYRNGNRGRAIIVPQVRNHDSFMKQAKKLHWVESLLEHLAGDNECDKEDSAQWLSFYLGKKHDGSFTLASEALGLPLVQRLDSTSALAMWSDANINYTQQRIIKKHLRLHFGRRLFISETTFSNDSEHYYVPTYYGEYKHYKQGDKTQKPERCSYWCRDPSLVVSKELSRLLHYLDPNLVLLDLNLY